MAAWRTLGPMSGPTTISLEQPHDTCFRCGRPTPPGVSLCEQDNPGRIKGPSPTQVHGTIVLGLIGGFVLFALLARLATSGGPFAAAVLGSASQADGRTAVVISVTNTGSTDGAASCRISQSGLVGSGDDVFFTEPIPAGATRQFERLLPAPAGAQPGRLPPVAVRCN
jgi:hypothetical protein